MNIKATFLILALAATAAMAQTVSVGRPVRVPTGTAAFYPLLTDDAQAVLVTQQDYTGLIRIDLSTGEQQVLSTQPRAGRNAMSSAVSTNDRLQIELLRGDSTILLTPNGADQRYLWPQLSPDQSRLVYTVSGSGTYVCDLMTRQVSYVGKMRAARWFDNQWLVAMQDSDDGYQVTASTLVMASADGTTQVALTGPDIKAMYPSAQAGHVAFCTPQGEVYVMTLDLNHPKAPQQ